jgi:flagellar basal body-associated protein FliL
MAKFKASKPKSATPPTPQMKAGLPCIVIIVIVIILVMVLMYLAMTHAS